MLKHQTLNLYKTQNYRTINNRQETKSQNKEKDHDQFFNLGF